MRLIFKIMVFFAIGAPSYGEDLRILTSFPSEMTSVFEDLWNDHSPEVGIQVLNKNTISAVEEIQRGNARGFDLFWASSPEAFVILEQGDHFVDAATCGADLLAPVTEFAISAVGWARHSDSTLTMPGDWNQLLLPTYRDQIAMARPARSGTMHLLVEQLLQVRGWDDGWGYFLELSGNLSTLTARSHGVPDGILNDRFGIGFMIDFLATSRGDKLHFQYGRPMMIFAASIGVLKGGNNQAEACEFVRLLLSRTGQLALTDPKVSRIPIDPQIRKEAKPAIPIEIATGLQLQWLGYDPEVSADRYWAVNALFDLMIIDVLSERRELWRRYYALKDRASSRDLARIRRLLTTVPVSEWQANEVSAQSDVSLRPAIQPAAGSTEHSALDLWATKVAEQIATVTAELNRIERELTE